ncbi:MAG: type II secretion system minor pseudopilin GspK [Wenzhouxiangellaceae bacterium]|nr:type II secretion system minor pseudopilin GspK [Wenzhouxiangellaceae bacterium]
MGRQRGAALLVALLAVALAAVLALELVEQAARSVARTTQVVETERAWQLAAGLEAMARDRIRQAQRAGADAALLDGQWTETFPVPGGWVRARLFDLGGRFNLNALAASDPADVARARRALAELLRLLGLAPELGERIASLYRPGPDGRRIGLAHISELERHAWFDARVRERLQPYIATLPDPAAPLNLNRASPEVLAALLDGLSADAARTLLARGPFESMDAALAAPELAALNTPALRTRLAVDSDWFLAQAQVELDGRVRDYFRLIGLASSRYDARYLSLGVP